MDGAAAEYQFCRYCEANETCAHDGGKLTERTTYVMRYVYEHHAGVTAYPLPGSWEDQPLWFIELFRAGRNKLIECENDRVNREMEKAKRRR